jgi:hypothetical protein
MARYLLSNVDQATVVTVSEDDDETYITLTNETYTDEQGVAKPKYQAVGYDDPNVTPNQPGIGYSALTLVSGTAYQDPTGRKTTVVIPITGDTAGTVGVAIGPTSGVAHSVVPVVAANAVASQVLSIPLPANWFIKVTASVATVTAGAQLG